jgi:hypothetical protein
MVQDFEVILVLRLHLIINGLNDKKVFCGNFVVSDR